MKKWQVEGMKCASLCEVSWWLQRQKCQIIPKQIGGKEICAIIHLGIEDKTQFCTKYITLKT